MIQIHFSVVRMRVCACEMIYKKSLLARQLSEACLTPRQPISSSMLLGLISMTRESVALSAGECIMSSSGCRVQAISANLPAWNLLSVSTKITDPSNLWRSPQSARAISDMSIYAKRCATSLPSARNRRSSQESNLEAELTLPNTSRPNLERII